MVKKPPGVDRQTWQRERDRVWRRRNWIFNILMVLAVAAILIRNCP